ncbi:hypothetical protein PIB30_015535 [Stylosanthes scabra]|uniref:Uncharacterized protein n=1 Tax=Stylosanthes scabra TaxID=79078 RepID=A0ABU6Z4G4_9FABA|nr:hypothetical protein [Stylosanthes scabra]
MKQRDFEQGRGLCPTCMAHVAYERGRSPSLCERLFLLCSKEDVKLSISPNKDDGSSHLISVPWCWGWRFSPAHIEKAWNNVVRPRSASLSEEIIFGLVLSNVGCRPLMRRSSQYTASEYRNLFRSQPPCESSPVVDIFSDDDTVNSADAEDNTDS